MKAYAIMNSTKVLRFDTITTNPYASWQRLVGWRPNHGNSVHDMIKILERQGWRTCIVNVEIESVSETMEMIDG